MQIPLIECPFQNCGKTISKPDVESILNLSVSLNKKNPNINFASCPTSDCPYVYELPKNKLVF